MIQIKPSQSSANDRGIKTFIKIPGLTTIPLAPTFNSRESILIRDPRLSTLITGAPNCELKGNFLFPNQSFKRTTSTTEEVQSDEECSVDILTEGREHLQLKFGPLLIATLKDNPVIPGQIGPADKIIEEALKESPIHFFTWINHLYQKHANIASIASDLVSLVGRLPSDIVYPYGSILATCAFSHQSILVKEAGLRAFENWLDKDTLVLLESSVISPKWLDDYRKSVIQSIKEQ